MSFSRVGHQNKCQRKVMVWLASGKLGGVSPLQHLGMDRVWDKQAISRARSWVWMLLLSLVHCLLHLPVEHPYHLHLWEDATGVDGPWSDENWQERASRLQFLDPGW